MLTTYCKLTHINFLLALGLLISETVPAHAAETSQPKTVSLYVTVEKDGKLIQGLAENNFRLYVDGDARQFQLAEAEGPASIALLVEFSDASRYYIRDIASAMEGFANTAPEGNWYALASFAKDMNIEVDFTKQRGKIANGFSDLRRPLWNEIDAYDAVYQMLDKMGRLRGRRILIFIGSGFDTFSEHTLDDVKEKLESVNVVVYCVGAGSGLRGPYEPYLSNSARMNLVQAQAFLNMLADKSGGQAWFPRFEAAFPDVLKGIMQMIQSQYRLVYTPQVSHDGELHEIKVEAFTVQNDQRQDFKVRVRDGWRF
jgi:VWFA-related protein